MTRDGERLPIGYYSCQLSGAESRYNATEMEALAIL